MPRMRDLRARLGGARVPHVLRVHGMRRLQLVNIHARRELWKQRHRLRGCVGAWMRNPPHLQSTWTAGAAAMAAISCRLMLHTLWRTRASTHPHVHVCIRIYIHAGRGRAGIFTHIHGLHLVAYAPIIDGAELGYLGDDIIRLAQRHRLRACMHACM